jgi:hypothetical protein
VACLRVTCTLGLDERETAELRATLQRLTASVSAA